MKDITPYKELFEKKFAKRFCHVDSTMMCPNEHCTCKIAAEIKAYIYTIIPAPYYQFDIDDFTGKSDKQELLDSEVAITAKSKLVKYCWNMNLEDFNVLDEQEKTNRSAMDYRRKQGHNIVIYADSEKRMSPSFGKNQEATESRCGKTMIASLVMQEAIKRRIFPGNHVQTYDWLEFSILCNELKSNSFGLNYAKFADWLVVDDIRGINNTRSMDSFLASLLDPFFFERLQEKLPTIFVFRFDIGNLPSSIEDKFGIAISQIINDPNTIKISLCEKNT